MNHNWGLVFALCLIIALVAGCSNQVLKQSDLNKEVVNNEDYASKIITLEDNGISIDLPIDQISEIRSYLDDASDQEVEIGRMHGNIIKTDETQSLSIIKYSCGTKMCDTVLVRKQGEDITSLKLPFGIFTKVVFSPNGDRALLVYGVNEGNTLLRNFLAVVDLNNMRLIQPQSEELAHEFYQEPIWPIVESQWTDNNTILITIPDTLSSDWDTLVEWFNNETKQTKEITIELQSLAEEIPLSFTNYVETYPVNVVDPQGINIVKETDFIDLSLLVFTRKEENSDINTLYVGVKHGENYYELGEIGYDHYLDLIKLESISLNGKPFYKLRGLLGANAPVTMYVEFVDGKPHNILQVTAHAVEADLDNNGNDIIIASVGTAAQTELYQLNEGNQILYTSLNNALHAQAVIYNEKDQVFEAYFGGNRVKYHYQKGVLQEIYKQDAEENTEVPKTF